MGVKEILSKSSPMVSKEKSEQQKQAPTEASKRFLKYLARPKLQLIVNGLGVSLASGLAITEALKGQYDVAATNGIIAGFFGANVIRSYDALQQWEAN
ncbi:Uncharacterised protein [uncultured archaeon]|nr:Uncharacterised protein [uncultured archaeon]